ncbi:sensor histidine kinase [Romboutsia sp.]|uniref:sensor histidine kinase n=1 Tax=Romboutsia sp. TaxID=1965302 RepID=UPI003F3DFDFC
MLYRITAYIMLSINMILYCTESNLYLDKLSKPISIVVLSISISMYMLYTIKLKNTKLLLANILYTTVVTYIYPPLLPNLIFLITEYLKVKNYGGRYSLLIVYILLAIKIELYYTNMFLGIIASIFIYEIMNYESRLLKLEKDNYKLREKNNTLEEIRKKENKTAHQNIEAVKIEERNLISQKLHDKIGHTLAGSIIQLEALKIVIINDTEKGKEMLENVIDNLRNGMDDIRQTLRRIKPEQEEVNLNNLKRIIDDFSQKSNISTNLKIEGDLNEVNLVYWRALIDCCREILTNSIKYSTGDLLNLEISVLNKIIRLHIKDNGAYKGSLKKGMGLIGIEERIINLGGDVYFDNENGFSTLIILKR